MIISAPETATKATLAQIIVPSSDTKYVPSSEWFCFQASGTASAEFRRNITLNGRQFQIVCDSKTDGGGWLVLSRRLSDNTVQFHNRPEPDMGWGDISSDFWLGTEIFHQLTSGPYKIELLMDMKLCDKNQVFRRKYKNFSVGNKQSGYELRVDRSPGEDDREGLSGSNGRPNRCFDEVGRQHGVSCWWWSTHPTVSINAEIGCDIPPPINNFWFTWKPQRRFQIKTVEMKIRPMPIGTPARETFGNIFSCICLHKFISLFFRVFKSEIRKLIHFIA